jgi:hypothetical protein
MADTSKNAWRQFLESVPPGTPRVVSGLFSKVEAGYNYDAHWRLSRVDIQLHCQSCDGPRMYKLESDTKLEETQLGDNKFLMYRCRNCGSTLKTFAVRIDRNGVFDKDATVIKFGEIPSYGPPLSSRLLTLLRDDSELLSKGRRSENQGMGIGAFGYYRRVVENQKAHLIAEVRKVAEKTGADADVLALYDTAVEQQQFSRAIDVIKDSIPQSLMMNGANPLTLLHDALSDGLHNLPDAECLELAREIRVVLAELVERISEALKDEAELQDAVRRLAERHRARGGV